VGAVVLAAALAAAGCRSERDARVTDAVKARLAGEPTPLVQLDVTTKDRIVKLEGVVATDAERERLERIVGDMDEVEGVDNRLTVQRPVEVTGDKRDGA
jgi:osmotically-inducible protein OsmY